jgi:hypothetical protein
MGQPKKEQIIMNKQFETPILFLIFNRPDTTQQVFNRIKEIKPKYLFVAADGPRHTRSGEDKKCLETRSIIQQVDWDCEVKTLYRESNLGCGIAVSSAITWFFDQVEQGIILEDDCLPDITFFYYCESLLEKYKHNNNILHINGTNYTGSHFVNPKSYYFTKLVFIWGWATWRRAWKFYDVEASDYPIYKNKLFDRKIFISKRATKHFKKAFDNMYVHRHKTWDTQWMYTVIKSHGLTITPQVNLVENIGLDNDSTHLFLMDSYSYNKKSKKILLPLEHPDLIVSDHIDKIIFENYRGKSIRRIIRIFKENGFLKVLYYYLKVHIKLNIKN